MASTILSAGIEVKRNALYIYEPGECRIHISVKNAVRGIPAVWAVFLSQGKCTPAGNLHIFSILNPYFVQIAEFGPLFRRLFSSTRFRCGLPLSGAVNDVKNQSVVLFYFRCAIRKITNTACSFIRRRWR